MVNEDNKEHTSILWKVLNGEKPTEEEIKRDIEDYKRRQREQGLITFSEVLDKLGLDLYITDSVGELFFDDVYKHYTVNSKGIYRLYGRDDNCYYEIFIHEDSK